ncbi:hypothetical protein [Alkalihalobacterium alkalinitrilicum]|nr:hypothetical protein [Alkalihalobacterium alkalinitrilicum]
MGIFIDDGRLKARDNNYAQNTTEFHNEDHLLEWFEEQFDKKG